MGDAGFFKGTSLEQDTRFADKKRRLMQSMKFGEGLERKVEMHRVNLNVLKPWIAQRITELLDFEDDVVVDYVINQLESSENPDPKDIQMNLTGFLQAKNSRLFLQELWDLLCSAMENKSGVPAQFIDAKKEELIKKEAEEIAIKQALREREIEIHRTLREAENNHSNRRRDSRSRGRHSSPKRQRYSPENSAGTTQNESAIGSGTKNERSSSNHDENAEKDKFKSRYGRNREDVGNSYRNKSRSDNRKKRSDDSESESKLSTSKSPSPSQKGRQRPLERNRSSDASRSPSLDRRKRSLSRGRASPPRRRGGRRSPPPSRSPSYHKRPRRRSPSPSPLPIRRRPRSPLSPPMRRDRRRLPSPRRRSPYNRRRVDDFRVNRKRRSPTYSPSPVPKRKDRRKMDSPPRRIRRPSNSPPIRKRNDKSRSKSSSPPSDHSSQRSATDPNHSNHDGVVKNTESVKPNNVTLVSPKAKRVSTDSADGKVKARSASSSSQSSTSSTSSSGSSSGSSASSASSSRSGSSASKNSSLRRASVEWKEKALKSTVVVKTSAGSKNGKRDQPSNEKTERNYRPKRSPSPFENIRPSISGRRGEQDSARNNSRMLRNPSPGSKRSRSPSPLPRYREKDFDKRQGHDRVRQVDSPPRGEQRRIIRRQPTDTDKPEPVKTTREGSHAEELLRQKALESMRRAAEKARQDEAKSNSDSSSSSGSSSPSGSSGSSSDSS